MSLLREVYLHDGEGNPIGSLDGALAIYDADVHSIPFNEFFHEHTGVNDTLAAIVTAGDTSITVTNGALFSVGDKVQIEDGIVETTFPTITVIVGDVLTLDRPLDNDFSIGNSVEVVGHNMNAVGTLATPISFKLIPDADQSWHVIGFSLSMVHSTVGDDSMFGNKTALQNGVVFRAYNGTTGRYRTFTLWKKNADIRLDTGVVVYSDKEGGGKYGTTALGQIKIRSGAVPKISGASGDYVEILIQDDLSSLTSFEIKAQGHIEVL